jgi:dolichyl-phosphate-mannose-protein mannosyltransferase
MEVVKRFTRLGKQEYTLLCLLIVVNLAIHFTIIQDPPSLISDEFYYINDAKVILTEHSSNRTEQPPLGKLLIASDVALFGDNPFGWRTFPIIFGTANIALLYLICRRLQMSRRAANIAAFLLTFENLSFVHSGIAMLDVFSLTFMMLSFWLYLRYNYSLSAVAVALATLSKLTGVFAIMVIFLHWLIARRTGKIHFIASMALAPLSFLLLMPVFEFAIYHRLTNFVSSIFVMLTQSTSLTFAFAATSQPLLIGPGQIIMPLHRPWEIVTLPQIIPYCHNPHYFGTISFTIWALIIPTFIYMMVKSVKKNEAGLLGTLWFISTYLVWIPIYLITDRITYVYYFYPAVGAICIALGMGLSWLIDFWQTRRTSKLRLISIVGVILFLVLHLGVFVFLAPVNPWPVERLLAPLM